MIQQPITMRKLSKKQNYDSFVRQFSQGIKEISPDACFYLYGSYPNGKAIYGRSDIDGGIILNSKTLTSKEEIRKISNLLKISLENNPVEPQFNLLDRQTNIDGQFLSYPPSYIKFFKGGDVSVISGPNLMTEMNSIENRNEDISVLASNFRTIRNTALYWEAHAEASYEMGRSSRRGFSKSIDHLLKFPKNIDLIRNGKTDFQKSGVLGIAQRIFPEFSHAIIIKTIELYQNPLKYHSFISDAPIEELREFHENVLTHYEKMIKSYIK